MSFTFADTHNMVSILNKSEASEGFNQIIDFINGSYIKYVLTVNPHIYVSCIKQFWNTVTVKQSNDVTRLQALVDRKKVVLMEVVIRDVLRLDDAEGVDCLPNEEIFAGLARRKFNFSKYIFESLVRNVDSSSKFYLYPRRVGKGSSGVETPLFEGMLVVGENVEEGHAEEQVQDADTNAAAQGTAADDTAAIGEGSMIDELDKDEGVALTTEKEEERKTKKAKDIAGDDQVKERQAEIYQVDMDHPSKVLSMQEDEPTKVEEVVKVVTTAKLITEVVTVASKSVSAASTTIPAVEPQVPAATPTIVPRYQVIKKRPQTEAQARKNMIMYLKNVAGFRLDYFKGMSYDDIRPIFEAKFNTNIEFLLKSKEYIEEEERREFQSINETLAQKAAKRRKLNEEVAELNKHLEIVPNEDDDVFTEATPLARKVPVVYYVIILLNNKPHYKIVKADGTHQLYVSFLTLLKNFDRDDLESLWSIVKERFSTTKPDKFTDDFLLTTLRVMFEKADD
nr:hypothetical protein [Tanacetum cinerariifolium]